jgi:adenosine deaminase
MDKVNLIFKVIEALNRGLQRAIKEFSIDVRLILCCMRQNPEWYVKI